MNPSEKFKNMAEVKEYVESMRGQVSDEDFELFQYFFVVHVRIVKHVAFALHPADGRHIKLYTSFLCFFIRLSDVFEKYVVWIRTFH